VTTQEVPDVLTKLSIPDLLNAWVLSWEQLGVNPTRAAVELKVAHVVLETGLKYCHCFNLGNVKHVDGDAFDWCSFPCGEEVQLDASGNLPAALQSPYVTRRGNLYTRNGAQWQSVWITPPHPWSRFRAFDTLADGTVGQIAYLKKHPAVVAALMTGDPVQYCQALHDAHYFTADPGQYSRGVQGTLLTVRGVSRTWDGWGDVP